MPLTDLPLSQIRGQRTTLTAPTDLVDFWDRTLSDSRARAVDPVFEPYQSKLYGSLLVDDVTFSGFDGQPIKAWLLRPSTHDGSLPCVVRYIGYGGGRGVPAEHAFLPATGIATLVMDTRGQGGVVGDSADANAGESGSEQPGWMTRGIAQPDTYFYRRVFTDAVLAVDAVAGHPAIDADRIAVAGRSQGGGIALAATALGGPAIKACWAVVPFLCDFRHAAVIATEGPYLELVDYLASRPERIVEVERTLSYFDCAILAQLINVPTTLTVGLMDACCPPSTIFSVFNALATEEKDVGVYEFSDHAPPPRMPEHEAEFVRRHLGV